MVTYDKIVRKGAIVSNAKSAHSSFGITIVNYKSIKFVSLVMETRSALCYMSVSRFDYQTRPKSLHFWSCAEMYSMISDSKKQYKQTTESQCIVSVILYGYVPFFDVTFLPTFEKNIFLRKQ